MFWNTVRDLVIVIDCNINKSMHTFMNSWKNAEWYCFGGFIIPARGCQMLNLLASVASILLPVLKTHQHHTLPDLASTYFHIQLNANLQRGQNAITSLSEML